jgi:cytochrome c
MKGQMPLQTGSVVWFVAAAILAFTFLTPAPAFAEDREARREARALVKPCKVCHQLTRPKRKFGPHLVNVIGRPVAGAEGYKFSKAMKALGGAWTEERLAAFLNDPAAYAPGTDMKFPGYKDMAKARLAAAYLADRTTR